MIFNRFFRSKHLDPNPHIRIKAIEKLNHELNEEKSVLHELAFNDPDAGVSLAALHKLNNFTLWYKMSEIGKDERVIKKSLQIVEKVLFDEQDQTLSDKEKRSFISQCKDHKLLEKLVLLPWVQQDIKLTKGILEKLSKPLILEKLLLETTNSELQLDLLESLNDEPTNRKLLNKLSKKIQIEKIQVKVAALLSEWQALEQLPISIEKDTRMVLSRLLALKDNSDLAHIKEQHQQLKTQYQSLSKNFGCLNEAKKSEIEHKWQELNGKLNAVIEKLSPAWEAQQAAFEQKQQVATLLIEGEKILANTANLLNHKMTELSSQEVEEMGNVLNRLYDQVQQQLSHLSSAQDQSKKELLSIVGRIHGCQETLSNLPAFMLCLGQSAELLSQVSELALPSDLSQLDAAEQYFKEIKQQWLSITHRFSKNLPLELVQQWHQVTTRWQGALKQLNKQVSDDLMRCRNKLRTIEGLVNQGRYRLAIEIFSKVIDWYGNLPEKQQGMLEKNYIHVKQQIENLKDWQEYIAAPRKPALLNDAQRLVDFPLSVEEQATAIKTLRQQWKSLGVIESESDQALNQAFDETIEKAFAPCRAHYEQQQKQREQNLVEKKELLMQLATLLESEDGIALVAKKIRTLQQRWRNIGEVEFNLRKELEEQFQQHLQPLRTKVNAFYLDNAEQKASLVTKAQKCCEMESVEEAIVKIKQLQTEWKNIEHAGRKAEAELWPAFKLAGDAVFAKRQEQNIQDQLALKQHVADVSERLNVLNGALSLANDRAGLESVLIDRAEVLHVVATLPDKDQTFFKRQLVKIEQHVTEKLLALESNQARQVYANLFATIALWKESAQIPDMVGELPNSWQQAFQKSNVGMNRHELTISMEIISNQESPQSDASKRQNLQMLLMAKKLQDGQVDSLDELLKQWLSCGPLNDSEQDLLERVKRLFC